jgi:histidine triad (HIT) family protein
VLVVPNEHVTSVNYLEEEHEAVMGYLLRATRLVAHEQGIGESGYRLIVNTGPDAIMTVPHLHVHVLGGRRMGWPPG